MVNEPRPWMLTVGELRQALAAAPDHQFVAFKVPPEYLQDLSRTGDPSMTVVFNVGIGDASRHVFWLTAAGPTEEG